jgi:hypothetical protein
VLPRPDIPEYPGRERWVDRVFYTGDNGMARALSAIWRDTPWTLGAVAGGVQFLAGASLRPAIRLPSYVAGADQTFSPPAASQAA